MSLASLQPSFDDLGEHLSRATFVVVDLETTGGSRDDAITEIGAVKVCGGSVVGEFQTLVRPPCPIPPLVATLTGITNQMVAAAPRLADVLPSFATFIAGSVLVAHNARFDVGFLRRGFSELGLEWGRPMVVDTVQLARQALVEGEVRNCKLATLAQHFGASTTPDHRALSDARATVDVLHGLLERVGNLGVHTVEDLSEYMARVSPERRAKRGWAAAAPEGPGVYWFVHDAPHDDGVRREVLYVGKSGNVRRRVRSYFSAAEQRTRIHEMVKVATGVEFLACATHLEAEVRELRMIASHAPRYNRRSRQQTRLLWLKLTREPFPRISVVRRVSSDGATYWGPFTTAAAAEEASLALHQAFPLRQCTKRLSARTPSASCALGQIGRCPAPCELGEGAAAYGQVVEGVRQAWASDTGPVLRASRERLRELVAAQRYEEAGAITARLQAFYRASLRHHRLRSLAACRQIIAAGPEGDGWAVHVIRHGKLCAAARVPAGEVRGTAQELLATAETVLEPPAGTPAGTVEEAERVAAWLESPGVRLLEVDGEWSWPVGAGLTEEQLARALMGSDWQFARHDVVPSPEPAENARRARTRRYAPAG